MVLLAALEPPIVPLIAPLGDRALLVRFGTVLSDPANVAAIRFAARVKAAHLEGMVEVIPSLVSVLVTYEPSKTTPDRLAGALRLLVGDNAPEAVGEPRSWRLPVRFGGADGPDLAEVAATLGLSAATFIAEHNARSLRVLATGFAPGFVYCGFHPKALVVPRRAQVRTVVPAGSLLFAAGQTAIAATDIPTGWHWIGRTAFRNFDPGVEPPTQLAEGDLIQFEPMS